MASPGRGLHVSPMARGPRPDGPRQGPERDPGSLKAFPKELILGPNVNVNHS